MPPDENVDSQMATGEGGRRTEGSPASPDKVGLVLGFALAGVLVVLYASRTGPVLTVPTSAQLGLVEELPITYFLGMGLLATSLILALRSRSDLLFAIAGAVFLGMLAGTPGLFEPNPPIWDSYLHFASAETIIRTGHIPTDPSEYAANWPGFFLLAAVTYFTGGFAPLQFVGLFPIFSGCITFVTLFVFLRSFFGSRTARLASILSAILNVWAQYHVSPQGIGLSLALLVLATAWDRRVPVRVANAVLFLGLVLSHATSTFFLLGILGLDFFIGQFFRRPTGDEADRRAPFRGVGNPFLAYVTVWLGWLFFVAVGSAETAKVAVGAQIGSILQVGEATANVVAARSVANIYVWPPRIRLAALGVYGLVSLVAIFALMRARPTRRMGRFFIAAFIALGILGASDILFFGGQIYDRAFMFFAVLAPALGLLGLRALQVKPTAGRVVLLGLVIVSLAAAATSNYQEPFYLVPNQSLAVSDFLSTHGSGVLVLDGVFPDPVQELTHEAIPFTELPFYTAHPIPLSFYSTMTPALAVFDQTARLWYVQGHGITIYQYYERERPHYSRIYDNGYAQIYLLNGGVPGG